MTELEKQAIDLIIKAESALFYCITDNDRHSENQAKQALKELREFLENNREAIVKEGI